MMKEVRLVKVALQHQDQIQAAERQLTDLINAGWKITTAGGGTAKVNSDTAGFIVLERDA